MSLYRELKDALSFRKNPAAQKKTSEREDRLIIIAAAAILLVIGVASLVASSAATSSRVQACKSIILSTQRYQCLSELATKTQNYSICSMLIPQSSSYQCMTSIAEAQRNVSGCERVNRNDASYDTCVENVSYERNNATMCSLLSGNNQSTCAYSVAKENGFSGIAYCNAIDNTSQKALCDSIYYYGAAQQSLSPTYCGYLPNEDNGTLLTTIVSKDYTNQQASNFSYLSLSQLNITPRDYCYYSIATESENQSVCNFASPSISQLCRESFSANSTAITNVTNATTICASAPSEVQGLCLYGVYTDAAISSKNVSYCMQITNATYQNSCIVDLVSKYKESSYCNLIANNDTEQLACQESTSSNSS